ncbi:MAG TPA: chloride channel protein [Gemmatimonadaceae bacterium]|nr:chloride channel protein [Gemmatimonadaceae bacterium]
MKDHLASRASTTGGLPIAPSMGPALDAAHVPHERAENHRRIIFISGLAILVAFGAGFVAVILMRLIGLITNLSFYGRFSTAFSSPADNHLGLWVMLVPAVGGVIVGIMARYGSAAIRGHGIPEAMEQVLYNESRVPPRVTILKPVSAAFAIGTGGPFGAEGPIIATGGALGSLVGQLLRTTADERKVLLAAGAAAGMAATFGSPVSAVLLAIELLLFEYRARSLVPVALAASAATAVRIAFMGSSPIFPMPNIAQPGGAALATYIVLGAIVGLASVYVTRAVYAIEDGFDKLPIHWMWWPALGGVAVGVIGYFFPHTMGVGYDNIESIVAGNFVGVALLGLVIAKFISWAISLGSGTSGGTLAPLFTIGGGLGSLLGAAVIAVAPSLGVDQRVAALVGMAAIFAGASRALLASVVFAFETTRQPLGLLPLLGGCSAAYLVSLLMMRSTIMTEKLARRGTDVEADYAVDFLSQILVKDVASPDVVALDADNAVEEVRDWMASREDESRHQGFPVVDKEGTLLGVVGRGDLLDLELPIDATVRDVIKRPPVVIFTDNTVRQAADHMVRQGVGRLPVVTRTDPNRVVGIVTRSDLLAAHASRLDSENRASRTIRLELRALPWRFRRSPVSLGDESGTVTTVETAPPTVSPETDNEEPPRKS